MARATLWIVPLFGFALATVLGHRVDGFPKNTCLCLAGRGVYIRETACGPIRGSASWGECFYSASDDADECFLASHLASFVYQQIKVANESQWIAKEYLKKSKDRSLCYPLSTSDDLDIEQSERSLDVGGSEAESRLGDHMHGSEPIDVSSDPKPNATAPAPETDLGHRPPDHDVRIHDNLKQNDEGNEALASKESIQQAPDLVLSNVISAVRAQQVAMQQTSCDSISMVTRQQWGARAPLERTPLELPTRGVLVHHTAMGRCYSLSSCSAIVRSIQDLHMTTKGWADIGYHFLVGGDGRVYEGRGWELVGAHCNKHGANFLTQGIAMIGTFTSELPSLGALATLDKLLRCGIEKNVCGESVAGHRDCCDTDCPGDALYTYLKQLPNYSIPCR